MQKRWTLILSISLLFQGNFLIAEEQSRTYGPWVWGINSGYVHQVDAGVDDADGDFSVSRAFIAGSLSYAWDRKTSVGVSIGVGESDYDFDRGVSIEGLKPWDEIREQRVSVPVRLAPTEKSSLIIIPSVRSYFEDGASFSDGQTEGVIMAAGWRFSDKLTLGPGFGWFSKLEGGSSAFPIVLLDWKITDRLSLGTGRGLAASQGPGLSLSYALDDNWTVSGGARYEKIQFALDDNRGIGEDSGVPLAASINYSPWPMTNVSAFAGVELGGKLELQDSSGRTLASSDYDSAPMVGLTLTTRF